MIVMNIDKISKYMYRLIIIKHICLTLRNTNKKNLVLLTH